MAGRQVALYFTRSRPDEVAAPLGILEDRFPALLPALELKRQDSVIPFRLWRDAGLCLVDAI
jgi:hypothetical protein